MYRLNAGDCPDLVFKAGFHLHYNSGSPNNDCGQVETGRFEICVAAMLLLSTISAGTGTGSIGVFLFLPGAGNGIAFSPLTSAIMGEAPLKDRGATSGLMRVMANLGSTLGVASVMCVATLVAGPGIAQVAAHLIPVSDLVPAFDMAFVICMLLEVAGFALMLAVGGKVPSGDGENTAGV